MNPSSFLTSLTLTQFRNYTSAHIETDAHVNVLTGHNGAGKTNILEAISLFSPGRGLRRAPLREMDAAEQVTTGVPAQHGWTLASEWACSDDTLPLKIGTARDVFSRGERRLVRVNGTPESSQQKLSHYCSVIWLTPQLDALFRDPSSARRRFLDRICYSFFPNHATWVNKYEKSMRERNRLLKDGARDTTWYDALEMQMAEAAITLHTQRDATITLIEQSIARMAGPFPRALIKMHYEKEEHCVPDYVQSTELYIAMLRNQRPIDMRAGRTLRGVHKTDLHVTHSDKHMDASLCSTGEQKALLLSITLAHALARTDHCGSAPIILLDEVVAHLDISRRSALFEQLHMLKAQIWATGTDAADFSAAGENAAFFAVSEGCIARQ